MVCKPLTVCKDGKKCPQFVEGEDGDVAYCNLHGWAVQVEKRGINWGLMWVAAVIAAATCMGLLVVASRLP